MIISLAIIILRLPLIGVYAINILHKQPWFKGKDNIPVKVNHKTFVRIYKCFKYEVFHRTAIASRPAPEAEIINLHTKEPHSLRSLERYGRPLVVSFGSYT